MTPTLPQEGEITAFSITDRVGRVRLDDGTELRVGQNALSELAPLVGRRLRVTAVGPHPLGGWKVVSADDKVAAPVDLTASLVAHEREMKAIMQREGEPFERARQATIAATRAEHEERRAAEARAIEALVAEVQRAFEGSSAESAWSRLLTARGVDGPRHTLVANARPAARLVRRDGIPPSGASRLGGLPDLPVGFAWPSHHGAPLAFLAQIAIHELPASVRTLLALPDGLLSVFFDCVTEPWDGLEEGERGALRLVWTPAGEPVAPLAPPEEDATTLTSSAVALSLHEDALIPYAPNIDPLVPEGHGSLAVNALRHDESIELLIGAHAERHGPSAGHVGGHANHIQPEGSQRGVLLLQLDSNEHLMFGDDGRLFVWISERDLLARRLDRAWHRIESH